MLYGTLWCVESRRQRRAAGLVERRLGQPKGAGCVQNRLLVRRGERGVAFIDRCWLLQAALPARIHSHASATSRGRDAASLPPTTQPLQKMIALLANVVAQDPAHG